MAFLYLTEQGSVLRKEGERLVVQKDDEVLLDIPAAKIESVLLFGNVQFTTQAVHLLFRRGVELALFTSHGDLLGQLTSSYPKNIGLRIAQYRHHDDAAFTLSFARSVVKAKLTNALELLKYFRRNHPDVDLDAGMKQLDAATGSLGAHTDLSMLLGAEGNGARAYFDAFSRMIRKSFGFTGRVKHPATDPVNALLSLGYTLIYKEIASLLDGVGFDPYLGFYHQPRHGHATLASDLLEEFRAPLVDRFTLYLINNRILQEDDFHPHAPSGGTYLKDDARKRYFLEYENFINHPVSTEDGGPDSTYRRLFLRQAERLSRAVLTEEPYSPYLFSWR
jgi:CRISPR-associated protein Cas1